MVKLSNCLVESSNAWLGYKSTIQDEASAKSLIL